MKLKKTTRFNRKSELQHLGSAPSSVVFPSLAFFMDAVWASHIASEYSDVAHSLATKNRCNNNGGNARHDRLCTTGRLPI